MLDKALYSIIRKNTMLNTKKLAYLESATIELTRNNILGDIVECGVWMGGSVALIAKLLLDNKDFRVLHLFDSFDDPHEAKPLDGEYLVNQLGGKTRACGRLIPIKGYYRRVTNGIGPGDPKKVFSLLNSTIGYPKDKIKIYKGWVQDTLSIYSKNIKEISMLILDCDLYEPQRLCLEYLYNRVVPGGLVIVDDYPTLSGCKLAIDEYREKMKIVSKIKRVANTGCIFWVK